MTGVKPLVLDCLRLQEGANTQLKSQLMDVLQMLAKQVCLAAALLPIIDCCSQTGDFEEIRKGMETKVERAELLAMAHFLQQLIADSVKDAGLAAAVGSPSRGGQQQGGAGYGASHNQQQQGGHGPRAPGAQEQYWADAAGTVSDAPYLYTADTAEYVHVRIAREPVSHNLEQEHTEHKCSAHSAEEVSWVIRAGRLDFGTRTLCAKIFCWCASRAKIFC